MKRIRTIIFIGMLGAVEHVEHADRARRALFLTAAGQHPQAAVGAGVQGLDVLGHIEGDGHAAVTYKRIATAVADRKYQVWPATPSLSWIFITSY